MAISKKDDFQSLEIQEVERGVVRCKIIGRSPMIMERFSFKARQELLFPRARQSRATLESRLKHNPIEEYRSAMYLNREATTPALCHLPNGMFHGAMCTAAIDIPGAARAKMERLTRITDININLFGVPQVMTAMVRSSDMNRTPDVRTRPIFPEWACELSIVYVKLALTEKSIVNLLGAAGVIVGVGGWRGEKGGPFGAFEIVPDGNHDYERIVKEQGRVAQQKAFDKPVYFDRDTEELLTWFENELVSREKDGLLSTKKKDRELWQIESANATDAAIAEAATKPKKNGKRAHA